MIPVAIPIAIAIFAFLLLIATTYAAFAGSDHLFAIAKKRFFLQSIRGEAALGQPSLMNAGLTAAVSGLQPEAGPVSRVEGYCMPEKLYYHQGHSWVALHESGTALVGIDEFAGKLIGEASSISLPVVGAQCRQGAVGWTLSHGGKLLKMLFPLDGKVVAVNERAIIDPEIVSREPYGDGWLLMVKPAELKRNLRNLFRGGVARKWMEQSAAQLRAAFSGKVGLVFQDGGLPEQGVADCLDESDWRDLADRLFVIETED